MLNKEDLQNGQVVCHLKHNRNYKIVSCNARQKDSNLGWVDCVFYQPLYENEYEMFSRELNSFLEEFDIVYENK